ncbi:MAG TPA: hypothetical protein VEI94_08815 [Candidatus Bathyarchaeia archaeon]|nr:hypothetical protein [Candidatus Bathyarchaeia archaeon]
MAEKSKSSSRRVRAARKKPSRRPHGAGGARARGASKGASARPTSPRSEIRALKQALARAQAEAASAGRGRDRAVARVLSKAQREKEALEAQLTKLVQEIGQLRQYAERAQRLEADCRQKDAQIAEQSRRWEEERAQLRAEMDRARAASSPGGHPRPAAAEAPAQPELFPGAPKS